MGSLRNLKTERLEGDLLLYNEDCVQGAKRIPNGSVDLIVNDPPFGIGESSFATYNRDGSLVRDGYVEAPKDSHGYYLWTKEWMSEAFRILRPGGTLYVFIGFTRMREVMNAAVETGFQFLNELIWKYDFGVDTASMKKYVTSHYSILYYVKPGRKRTYNRECRFSQDKRDILTGNSLNYADREDVFDILRDRKAGREKNPNKLPRELVEKLIEYSSDEGDLVCDFFMGEFTTAYCSRRLGRRVVGFELNSTAYDHHLPQLQRLEEEGYDRDREKPRFIRHRRYPSKNMRVRAESLICLNWETETKAQIHFI